MTLKKGETVYFARLACASDTVVATVDVYEVANDLGEQAETVLVKQDGLLGFKHLFKKHCFKTHGEALASLRARCKVWIKRWDDALTELH